MPDPVDGPWGKRQREQERDVFELTERHAAAYRNLSAWERDTADAEQRGFKGGVLWAFVISAILWAIVLGLLHYFHVII